MNASQIIELVVGISPLVGVPLLVWLDPAHLNPNKTHNHN